MKRGNERWCRGARGQSARRRWELAGERWGRERERLRKRRAAMKASHSWQASLLDTRPSHRWTPFTSIYRVLSLNLNSGPSGSFYGITPLLNRVRSPFPLMWTHHYFYKGSSSAWLMEFTGSNPQWVAGPVQRAGCFCERGPIARLQTKANRHEGTAIITQTYFLRQHQSSTRNISLSLKDYLLIGC